MSSIKRVLCKLIMCIIILRVDSFQIKRSLDIYRKKPIDFYQPYNRKLYCQNEAETNIIQIDANSSSSNDQPFLNISSGFFLLNFVAILWGTQHCVIKSALDSYPSSSILNFWRFSLSTLLFMPSLIDSMKIKDSKEWKAGAELGLYTFLGFGFQAIGLETTTAARSAFLLYLNVKLVPFLGALVFKREIKPLTWVSAFLAFGGTCLLSTDGGPINIGDFWCIGAAVVSALFILRLEKFSQENNASRLNSISFFSVAVLCSIWVLGDFYNGIIDPVSIDRIPVLQEFPSLINIPNQILTVINHLSSKLICLFCFVFGTSRKIY